MPQSRQVSALRGGAEIIVACPGRLEDLMKQGHVHLDNIEVTVIDEADHMADLGFLPGVTRILNATPARSQRMLFSATLDNGVHAIVKRFLHDPLTHSVDEETSHVEAMTHHVFHLDGAEAKRAMINALASGQGRRILFMRTKHHAKKLAKQLSQDGIPAVDLHGNLSQGARDRNLAAFGAGTVRVLVATDVAARGVHVDDVQLVVHVDPPVEHKSYLHRSGRTARAGAAGDVVTLVLPEQRRDTNALLRKAAISATPLRVHAGSPEVGALVGERALHVPVRRAGRGAPARGQLAPLPVQQRLARPAPRAQVGRASRRRARRLRRALDHLLHVHAPRGGGLRRRRRPEAQRRGLLSRLVGIGQARRPLGRAATRTPGGLAAWGRAASPWRSSRGCPGRRAVPSGPRCPGGRASPRP